jgi:hypothetical protein
MWHNEKRTEGISNADIHVSAVRGPSGPGGPCAEGWDGRDVRLQGQQAEAERERRARIISADGEYQASKKLAQAAAVMSADPAALQLRLLQTVVEVAAEKNSTLVMPVPVELLRFFDRAAPATTAQDTDTPPPAPEIPALTIPATLPASAALTAPLNAAPKAPAAI